MASEAAEEAPAYLPSEADLAYPPTGLGMPEVPTQAVEAPRAV